MFWIMESKRVQAACQMMIVDLILVFGCGLLTLGGRQEF
jgi:hypothetical protein